MAFATLVNSMNVFFICSYVLTLWLISQGIIQAFAVEIP